MEFNSLKKPAVLLSITFIAILFILFNLNSHAEISFLFARLGQVPLLVIVLLSFALGCAFTFFLFVKGLRSGKKDKPDKKSEKKKDEEKKDATDKK